MTPSELAKTVPFGSNPPREAYFYASLAVNWLAKHIAEVRTYQGLSINDAINADILLMQYADALRLAAPSAKPFDPTCPDCGHIHEGEDECKMQMGGGRECLCERRVSA
jgi:hypothetical protein